MENDWSMRHKQSRLMLLGNTETGFIFLVVQLSNFFLWLDVRFDEIQ